MSLTRAELLRMALTAKAIAAECERRLKNEMHDACVANTTFESWRIPGVGTVSASQNQDRAEVVDQDALLAWVAQNYPTEIETVTRVRNAGWLAKLLEDLVPVTPAGVDDTWEPKPGDPLPARDAEGSVVPGVSWRMGGDFRGVSITPDRVLVKQLTVRARDFVASGQTLPALAGRVVFDTDDGSGET